MKLVRIFSALIFIVQIGTLAAQTRSVCLNGEWQFMPDYKGMSAEEMVKNPVWESRTVRVPSVWKYSNYKSGDYQPFKLWDYPDQWEKADAGLLSREISPDPKPGERTFLVFKGVLLRSDFFLDNQKIFSSQEAFLPIEFEITEYIKKKEPCTLSVWAGPFKEIANNSGQMKVVVPCGSFMGAGRGIWQDVFLEYRPSVFIEDAHIKTSTRKEEIDITVRLNNQGAPLKNLSAAIEILDGGKVIKTWAKDNISTVKDADGYFQFRTVQKWTDAVYWSPGNPHLYQARISIYDGKKKLENNTYRFGFREVWSDGFKFILNGKRVNLRGDAWHFNGMGLQTPEYARNWYQMCFDAGINFIRLHAIPYPDFFYDVADEMGMLIIDESAIYGSAKRMQADNPEFIANCHAHLKELVLRDRNHPSVIIWSMQNEMRWVDGREGYMAKIGELTATMNKFDGTRAVSYDGDNRLVAYEDQQIENLHYNIDGSLNSWKKEKPLVYGELGAWHYVSPQVASNLMGPESYLSYDACMKNMGKDMQYFIEYARKEDVTGITPFNTVHYMNRAIPEQDSALHWKDVTTPGVKPDCVRKYGLELNNGWMKKNLKYIPNPSFNCIQEAFKPVAVFCDQYNRSFYGGRNISRSFSVYNDTESQVEARLEIQVLNSTQDKIAGETYKFTQQPGERANKEFQFKAPEVVIPEYFQLVIRLFHGSALMYEKSLDYRLYPELLLTEAIVKNVSKLLVLTKPGERGILCNLLPGATFTDRLDASTLKGKSALLIDEDMLGDSLMNQFSDRLGPFVRSGGRVLILAQSSKAPGELTLSGKKFFKAFVNIPDHPVMKGLSAKDLEFWGTENYHAGDNQYMVQNAFNKPVQGNMNLILECATGDWGWGGLLWTPMLEYTIGQGNILLCQVNIGKFFDSAPQASVLLRNMIGYTLNGEPNHSPNKSALISSSAPFENFFKDLGLEFDKIEKPSQQYTSIIIDPSSLSPSIIDDLRDYMLKGGNILVPDAKPNHQKLISLLANTDITINKKEAYQLAPAPETGLMKGISVHDLYLFEKVTYSRGDVSNTILADNYIANNQGKSYLNNVDNPWADYFISGNDGESVKVGVATQLSNLPFSSLSYGKIVDVGKGSLNLCQVKLHSNNPKVQRVYSRMLANLGLSVQTNLFDYVKDVADYGIYSFMYIRKAGHQDLDEMIAYYSNPGYVLNNLGEGVYGWMQPAETKNGEITIPKSAGNTYFLTVFIDSEINRDPSKRTENELPNDKIMPDLYLTTNSSMKLFVNGKEYLDKTVDDGQIHSVKIEDILLSKGINRMALVVQAGKEDLRFNLAFKDKFGEFLTSGITYKLTLD